MDTNSKIEAWLWTCAASRVQISSVYKVSLCIQLFASSLLQKPVVLQMPVRPLGETKTTTILTHVFEIYDGKICCRRFAVVFQKEKKAQRLRMSSVQQCTGFTQGISKFIGKEKSSRRSRQRPSRDPKEIVIASMLWKT
jgi:hypothetical protein